MSQAQQKQAGMSLKAFAMQEGLTKSQAQYLAKCGRIMGACKNHSGDWLVFPPAKLTEPLQKRRTCRDREATASASAASAFGTSPHGLAKVDRSAARDGASAHSQQVQGGSHAHSTGWALNASGMTTPEQGAPNGLASVLHPNAVWRGRAGGFEDLGSSEPADEGGRVPSTAASSGEALPAVFTSTKVLKAVHSVEVGGSQRFYPVVLSGAQVLLLDKLLAQESEALSERLELHEFELEAFALIEAEQSTVKATQRVLRQATTDKNRADAHASANKSEFSI